MTKRKAKLFESTMARKPGATGTGEDIERAVAKAQRAAPPVTPPPKRGATPAAQRKPTWQKKALETTKRKGRKYNG